MRVRVRDQLLGGHVYDVVVAREDVVQLRLHALGDDRGRVLAVELVHTAVDQVLELAVGVLYLRREEPVGQELYLLAHVRNRVRVRHDGLVGRLLAEVGELLEHLRRRAEIERVRPVGVGELLRREQDAAVNLVARVEEVHVARGDYGPAQLAREASRRGGSGRAGPRRRARCRSRRGSGCSRGALSRSSRRSWLSAGAPARSCRAARRRTSRPPRRRSL